ncbi:hypothetical protein N1851_000372 [Merluccius polli]|uniref:Fibronectin type-III domain-containing protein n=1 Tax=Merluccius polli TaxID=89951 RepID=A0AA47PBW5_MERPO|nr:hypothetical protein N1851_000372 [Merluccius polli]
MFEQLFAESHLQGFETGKQSLNYDTILTPYLKVFAIKSSISAHLKFWSGWLDHAKTRDGWLDRSDLVVLRLTQVLQRVKPKAPTIPPEEGKFLENGNYLLEWETNYPPYPGFTLKAVVTYGRRGENGTEASVDRSTTYQILGTSLEPSTEYWVNVRSYNGNHERSVNTLYSESSGNLTFTTRKF